MQILVDADAFPNVIKDILIRVSVRFHVPLVFVANQKEGMIQPHSVLELS